jgi:anti-sigma regulatory factor (Ser/Thr protein kinase)
VDQTPTITTPTAAPQAEIPNTPPSGDETVQISITLPTNAYFLSGIRDFTLTMTKNMTGFSDQWAFRFQSVVDELCNNAIEHGSALGQEIVITFIGHPQESLEIIVDDSGTGPNKYTAAEMQGIFKEQVQKVQTQFLGLRGRGLAKIVAEWTDEIKFEDSDKGGLRVRVKKYIKNP